MAVNRDVTKNYNLGGGELFLKLKEESNFRYFGATNEFKVNFSQDKLEHESSETNVLVTDLEVVKKVTAEVSFTTEDLNKEVLALAFGGEYNDSTQSSGSVTDQEFDNVQGGLVYELGKVKVSNVVVTYEDADGNEQTAEENKDYSVNYNFGTIEIAKGGAIDGKDIKVDYNYAEIVVTEFKSLNKLTKEMSLRFMTDPQIGQPKQTTIHRIILSLEGDYSLKDLNNLVKLSFKGKILKDDTKEDGKQFLETIMLAS